MKSRILAGAAGLVIAVTGLLGTTSASASPLQSFGVLPEMPICTSWLIEHAIPCLPAPPPFHRHDVHWREVHHAEHNRR